MNYNLKYKKLLLPVCLIAVVTGLVMFSCNKPFSNTLKNDNRPDGEVNTITRKTLLIVVDGAVGSEVREAAPPTLSSLVDFSIYSWDGLTDFRNANISNPYAWATLLTGANENKHHVSGDDFSDNNLENYPSLFTRIKQSHPDWRTSAFCASSGLADNLAADATEKKSFSDDAAVAEGATSELQNQDPSLVMVEFNSVDEAGKNNSYSVSSPEYKEAILKVDSYIGDILEAMRNRSSFQNENWMVIVTSNKGSNVASTPSASWSAFDDRSHNTFFFCYNPRFSSEDLNKPSTIIPYLGTSPYYTGTQSQNRRATVVDGGSTYDFGATGSYTIQCKVKFPATNVYYPAFLSKRAGFTSGVPGWVFFREGDYWQINFGQTGKGNRQIRGHSVADGQWHTLTAVIRQEGAARNVYTYTDGVLYPFTGNRDISSYGNINSPADLTVGNLPPDNNTGLTNYFVTDIRIYDTALTDEYIANNFCKTDIGDADPYKDNVLGFWPSTSVTPEKTTPDLSANHLDLVIQDYNPGTINDATSAVCPSISDVLYRTVPNSVDVAVQIYQWLGITVPASWQLDGKNWIPAYSDLGFH